MSGVVIAGVGNIFLRDDGFGVEVARALQGEVAPEGVRVLDVGIRGLHLAYELLEPMRLLVVVDAASRGGKPGTLYVIEPRFEEVPMAGAGAHDLDLHQVISTALGMGATLPRILLVGCEPDDLSEGIGLSPAVAAAVPAAADAVRELVREGAAPTAAAKEPRA